MDYHHCSSSTVAAWRLRWESKSKFPKNRQLDPHSDRNRDHTCHPETPWSVVIFSRINDWTGSIEADEVFILLNRKVICHPVNHRLFHRSTRRSYKGFNHLQR